MLTKPKGTLTSTEAVAIAMDALRPGMRMTSVGPDDFQELKPGIVSASNPEGLSSPLGPDAPPSKYASHCEADEATKCEMFRALQQGELEMVDQDSNTILVEAIDRTGLSVLDRGWANDGKMETACFFVREPLERWLASRRPKPVMYPGSQTADLWDALRWVAFRSLDPHAPTLWRCARCRPANLRAQPIEPPEPDDAATFNVPSLARLVNWSIPDMAEYLDLPAADVTAWWRKTDFRPDENVRAQLLRLCRFADTNNELGQEGGAARQIKEKALSGELPIHARRGRFGIGYSPINPLDLIEATYDFIGTDGDSTIEPAGVWTASQRDVHSWVAPRVFLADLLRLWPEPDQPAQPGGLVSRRSPANKRAEITAWLRERFAATGLVPTHDKIMESYPDVRRVDRRGAHRDLHDEVLHAKGKTIADQLFGPGPRKKAIPESERGKYMRAG